MKGWALTVGGAFFGFSVKDLNPRIAAVGLLPVLCFWGLDAYFLSRERMFRRLYDAVRTSDPHVEPFSMNYKLFMTPQCRWRSTVRSITLWPFYVPILGVGVAAIIAGAAGMPRESGPQPHPSPSPSTAGSAAKYSRCDRWTIAAPCADADGISSVSLLGRPS